MRIKKFFYTGVILVLLSALLSGCGSSVAPFRSKELKKEDGINMAVLPFDNLSKTQGAGKIMENYILVEFLKRSPLDIIEPGEVLSVLSQERIRLATSVPRETINKIGKRLDARLLMIGIVHEYEMQLASGPGGSGQVPVIAVSLRIVDADTGNIVWAVSAPRRGTDNETVFGIGRIQSMDRLAQKTAEEIAQAFTDSMKK
ncbi:MAG: hypothetical protein C4526_08915 [Nitrospiraceae bacterium]|nr:MAG: hypothetical protein C4526_08915 [Nitrospiraceae bacterium]